MAKAKKKKKRSKVSKKALGKALDRLLEEFEEATGTIILETVFYALLDQNPEAGLHLVAKSGRKDGPDNKHAVISERQHYIILEGNVAIQYAANQLLVRMHADATLREYFIEKDHLLFSKRIPRRKALFDQEIEAVLRKNPKYSASEVLNALEKKVAKVPKQEIQDGKFRIRHIAKDKAVSNRTFDDTVSRVRKRLLGTQK